MQGTELEWTLCASYNRYFTLQMAVHILKTTGNRCLGVWPEHSYFFFLEGGLLCVEN